MKKFLKTILLLLIVYMSVIFPAFCQATSVSSPKEDIDYETGKVVKVISESQNKVLESSMGGKQTIQIVKIRIVSGKNKGKIIVTENQLTSNPAYDIKVAPGDRVVLDVEKPSSKNPEIFIADKERLPALMILGGLFLLLLLITGGYKGLKSIICLGVTAFLVIFVMVPAILNDYPILPVTIGICVLSTFVTIFTVGGVNLKSLSAVLGTAGGVIVSGLMAGLVIKIAPLSGLWDQEAIILWSSRPDLNFSSLLMASMIVGSLGAIMDVGISIASSISEMKDINSSMCTKKLITSGMNVGKDIMGAMSNTLILAYIGSSFPLLLLATNAPIVKFLNLNSIAVEITAALAGSIGIILCVPMTAIISGYLIGGNLNLNIFAKNKSNCN